MHMLLSAKKLYANYLYNNIELKQESGRHIQIGIVLASSDAASYITETTIYVDRGLTLSS